MTGLPHVPLAFQCIYGWSHKRDEDGHEKEGREWRLPGLLFADDLVLCFESEEDQRAMVGKFVEMCRRRGLKVNAGGCKVMVMKERRDYSEVYVDGICLEHVSEFRYLGCALDESGTEGANFSRKAASGRMVADPIRSLVNPRV